MSYRCYMISHLCKMPPGLVKKCKKKPKSMKKCNKKCKQDAKKKLCEKTCCELGF